MAKQTLDAPRQYKQVPLHIKAVEASGEFSGYGSVFGVVDSYGDIVMPGAFQASLADWASKGRMPAMLWQHDVHEPIGVYASIAEDDLGLDVKGRLLIDDDPLARRAHAHLKAGSISGLSIGYTIAEQGARMQGDNLLLEKINLWEVSLVTFPANDEARVQQVKSALCRGETPSIREVERFLRDAGFSARQAKAFLADGYSAINPRDEDDDAELIQRIKQLTASINQSTIN